MRGIEGSSATSFVLGLGVADVFSRRGFLHVYVCGWLRGPTVRRS